MGSDKNKEIPLSWFVRPLLKYTPLYIEMVFIAICLRLLGLIEPFIFQVLIDRILPFQREASLLVVVSVFVGVSIFQMGFEVLKDLLGILTANKVTHELGVKIYNHLFKLPYGHFRRYTVGETLARVGETETIKGFLVGTSTGIILDLLFVFIYIGVLLAISPLLTAIVLIALPLQALVYIAFGPALRNRLRTSFDTSARHQTRLIDNITGIAAVKSLGAEPQVVRRLDRSLKSTLDARYRVELVNIFSDQLTFIIERGVTISILFFGATLVFSGDITLGQLVAFYMLAENVTDPIANFSSLWEAWQNIKVSRQRLGNIVNTDMENFALKPNLPADTPKDIVLTDVSFYYHPSTPILSNMSFQAQPHTLNLIVGPSGVGKSTFGRLAAGIESPVSGHVYIGGLNLSEFDPHSVRSHISYVPQQPYLFEGTIRDNLLFGSENASEDEIRSALKLAAADDLLVRLPDGLDTSVGERGSALSGGQMQRIAIARSILRNPKVLILDEPMSALDEETQKRLVESLIGLKAVTTLIVITHQSDIFAENDQIYRFMGEPL